MVFASTKFPVRHPASRVRVRCKGVQAQLLLLSLLTGLPAASARTDEGLLSLQRAAVAHAGLSTGATARLLARQHLSALLPQLRVTIGRGWQLSGTDRALDGLTGPTVDNDHTSYAVSAGWDLARLLSPRESLSVHHDEPRRARQRLELMARVARLVAARCHLLQVEAPRASQLQQVAELEAALDLLTGGHALPPVTPVTRCPAAPRFAVPLTRSAAGDRTSAASRAPRTSRMPRMDEELEEADGLPDALLLPPIDNTGPAGELGPGPQYDE